MTTRIDDMDLEARLRRTFAAHEDLVDPVRVAVMVREVFDPAEDEQSTWRRRRPLLLAVVAATVVVTLGVGVAQLVGWPDRGIRSARTGPSSPSDAANKRSAEAFVRHVVDTTPVLPEARPTTAALAVELGPGGSGFDASYVAESRFWVAPGTPAQAVAYLRAHAPTGYQATVDQVSTVEGVVRYSLPGDGPDNDAYAGLDFTVVLVSRGTGEVVVEATAQTWWREVRRAETRLPGDARLVTVVATARTAGSGPVSTWVHQVPVTDDTSSDVVKRLTAARAAIRTQEPTCTEDAGAVPRRYDLAFTTSRGPYGVTVWSDCVGVEVTRAGHLVDQRLSGSAEIVDLVSKLDDEPTTDGIPRFKSIGVGTRAVATDGSGSCTQAPGCPRVDFRIVGLPPHTTWSVRCRSTLNGEVQSSKPLVVGTRGSTYSWAGQCLFGEGSGDVTVQLSRGDQTVTSPIVRWPVGRTS